MKVRQLVIPQHDTLATGPGWVSQEFGFVLRLLRLHAMRLSVTKRMVLS